MMYTMNTIYRQGSTFLIKRHPWNNILSYGPQNLTTSQYYYQMRNYGSAMQRIKETLRHPAESAMAAGDRMSLKAGDKLVKGVEKAEKKVHDMHPVSGLKHAGDKINHMVGDDLVKGIDAIENLSNKVSRKANKTLDETEKKAHEVYKQQHKK